MQHLARAAFFASAVFLAGCGSDEDPPAPAIADSAVTDALVTDSFDATAADVGDDVAEDSGAVVDSGADSSSDTAGADTAIDSSLDTSIDATPDATPDTALDTALDTAVDSSPEASPDTSDALSCPSTWVICSGSCVELSSDKDNCGMCGTACPTRPNASPRCSSSACGFSCSTGFRDCNGNAADGCEVNSLSDRANCGGCGNVCPSGAFCGSGTCVTGKRVFVTSQLYAANLGGLTGADAKCQTLATGAGMSGTFRAWLSDSTGSPSTRFAQSTIPYRLVTGTMIATDWADLVDGILLAPINRTETGGVPPRPPATCTNDSVFTNTTASGTSFGVTHCGNWLGTEAGSVRLGRYGASDTEWTTSCTAGGYCTSTTLKFPLFCFEQ